MVTAALGGPVGGVAPATVVGVACALLAAVSSALGALRQHAGVRAVTAGGAPLRLRGLPGLARDASWAAGFVLLALGAVLQITALALAPLTVVAPVVALQLPLIAVFGARERRPDSAARVAVVVTTVAVGTFVVGSTFVATPTEPSGGGLLVAILLVAAAVAVGATIGARAAGRRRAVVYALSAGAGYGLIAVLVREAAGVVTGGEPLVRAAVAVAGIVLTFAAASWLVQLAYTAGPADLVVACQTVLNPIVAVLLGSVVLRETSGTSSAATALLLACGAAAMGGVAALARGSRTALGARGGP